MAARLQLVGEKFGRLTVFTYSYNNKDGRRIWSCLCTCGAITYASTNDLRSGKKRSCGCILDEHRKSFVAKSVTHGKTNTPEYIVWESMRKRCGNPKHMHFNNYGGRGISVCERWRDFANFFEDMGPRPSLKHTIDRVNNDGNYEPGNCRWATRSEQARNQRPRKRKVSQDQQWALHASLSASTWRFVRTSR